MVKAARALLYVSIAVETRSGARCVAIGLNPFWEAAMPKELGDLRLLDMDLRAVVEHFSQGNNDVESLLSGIARNLEERFFHWALFLNWLGLRGEALLNYYKRRAFNSTEGKGRSDMRSFLRAVREEGLEAELRRRAKTSRPFESEELSWMPMVDAIEAFALGNREVRLVLMLVAQDHPRAWGHWILFLNELRFQGDVLWSYYQSCVVLLEEVAGEDEDAHREAFWEAVRQEGDEALTLRKQDQRRRWP